MSKMSNWLNGSAFNEKDEYYTPKMMVDVILPFIPKGSTVWCPFDTQESEFVYGFKENHNVIHSHIWEGKSFFDYEPDNYDFIVSNPPFTAKLNVLKRLYKLNKPFAMILPLPILNYQEIGSFFIGKELQLLIVDKKVSFNGKPSSFNCSYFCRGILDKDLTFVNIENTNVGKYYKPSRMEKI